MGLAAVGRRVDVPEQLRNGVCRQRLGVHQVLRVSALARTVVRVDDKLGRKQRVGHRRARERGPRLAVAGRELVERHEKHGRRRRGGEHAERWDEGLHDCQVVVWNVSMVRHGREKKITRYKAGLRRAIFSHRSSRAAFGEVS